MLLVMKREKKLCLLQKNILLVKFLEACEYYIKKTGRRITFEYSLVAGVNDGKEDAKSLI